MAVLRLHVNEEKALETLVWIANAWSGVSPFCLSGVLFLAEKDHFNKYGRPIIADTYAAMPYGAVPLTVRSFVEGNYLFSSVVDKVAAAIEVDWAAGCPAVRPKRKPIMGVFSISDLACLGAAVQKCQSASLSAIAESVRKEKAWLNAPANGVMAYEDFVDDDNPHRTEILEQVSEMAAEFGHLVFSTSRP